MIFGAALLAPLLSSVGASLVGKLLGPSTPSAPSLDDFNAMLNKARAGDLTGGEPVTLGNDANLHFTPDQMLRLAHAADRAAASGMTSALVLMDGQAFKLDVASRTITGAIDPASVAVGGIDGVISAPPSCFADLFKSPGAQPADPAASAAQTQPLMQQQQLLNRLNGARSTLLPRVRWSLSGTPN